MTDIPTVRLPQRAVLLDGGMGREPRSAPASAGRRPCGQVLVAIRFGLRDD